MIGYITVSKEEAKRIIDQAPGDEITLAVYNIQNKAHKKSTRKSKKASKEIIEIAKEVGFQNNDFFGVIGCKTVEREGELIKDILFPLLERSPGILDYD